MLLCSFLMATGSFAQSDEGGDARRALGAYSYLHRLFLEFLQRSPALVTSAREIVQGFIDDPAKRTMEVRGEGGEGRRWDRREEGDGIGGRGGDGERTFLHAHI